MEIIKAYKTSRGYFTSHLVASTKKNRAYEYGSRFGEQELEPVKTVFLLSDGDGLYFELKEVVVDDAKYI